MLSSRKRRLAPKPPDPPEGMMWHYWKLVPIEEAEAHAKKIMRGFDRLPRERRDLLNYDAPKQKRKRRRR
jgi:hypothetical protein